MPWRGPEYEGEFPSLGWGLVEFWESSLTVPAGPMYGQPFRLTEDQARFFVRLYALRPDGSFVYRRGSRRGAKGKGKSPEGGLFTIGEFAGPVVFDGWDADGEPVGRPRDYPWVQILACSDDQTSNLYGPMRAMLAESDLIDESRIDLGKTRVEFTDRPGRIEAVTSSAGAREGTPITAAVLEETHLWLPSRGGDRLAAVTRRNLAKTGGRSLEVTNAPALGEDSAAESTLKAADKNQKGLLYDSVEGPWVDDPKHPDHREKVLESLRLAYGEAAVEAGGWVDLDRIYEEICDESTTEADVARFYFNIARKSENRAFDAQRFDQLEQDRTPDGPWVLMFDGAYTRDCAVFTAWSLDAVPHHKHVASWVRPKHASDDYEHPVGEMRATPREFIATHDVVVFAFDSSFRAMRSLYDDWSDEFGDLDEDGIMLAYPTAEGKRMEGAIERAIEDTRQARYTHDGHPLVTEHVHAALLTKNRSGFKTLTKPAGLHIDAAVTFTFGYDLIPLARQAAGERSKEPEVMFAYTE